MMKINLIFITLKLDQKRKIARELEFLEVRLKFGCHLMSIFRSIDHSEFFEHRFGGFFVFYSGFF